MGAAQPRVHLAEHLVACDDVGPPRRAAVPAGVAYSFESALLLGHFVRHRGSAIWADAREAGTCSEEAERLYALDASFVLVPGLAGRGHSLRSANFPLEYVWHQDSRAALGEYDGSDAFRRDAGLELRAGAEEEGALDGEPEESAGAARTAGAAGAAVAAGADVEGGGAEVCFALLECPGRYLCVDKDGRVVSERYSHLSRRAFRFRLVPALGLRFDPGIAEPLVREDAPAPRSGGGGLGTRDPGEEARDARPGGGGLGTRGLEEEAWGALLVAAAAQGAAAAAAQGAVTAEAAAAEGAAKAAAPGHGHSPPSLRELGEFQVVD